MNNTITLRDEISEIFFGSVGNSGFYKLESAKNIEAYVNRNKDQKTFGVAIAIPENTRGVDEYYSHVHFYTSSSPYPSEATPRLLILDSSFEEGREEFSLVCESLLKEEKESLFDDPLNWWNRWKHLIGNAIKNINPYDVIGEMIVLKYLKENGFTNLSWNNQDKPSTHDISADGSEHEVKSTVVRKGYDVHISSRYQLDSANGAPLYLYFCRFEKTSQGTYSITSMRKQLLDLGVDEDLLENQLIKRGLRRNSSERDDKYNLLELRKYEVNFCFPKITDKSFVSPDSLKGIKSFEYTIDLSNLESTSLR